jgi:phosphoribosylanthranilate isomerase
MTVVKICGMRELSHMIAAAEAGADMLGLNFLPRVRRYIEPDAAKELANSFREHSTSLGAGLALPLVGLFADQPVEEVNEVAARVGLDMVQLCGDEPIEYWSTVTVPILKVVHVLSVPKERSTARNSVVKDVHFRLQEIDESGHIAMLDRQSDTQPGGLGETFDWSIARDMADRGHRFLLAGGLTPENVGEAIESTQPYGVDVSSGVETDGAKNIAKIQAFIAAARATDVEHLPGTQR